MCWSLISQYWAFRRVTASRVLNLLLLRQKHTGSRMTMVMSIIVPWECPPAGTSGHYQICDWEISQLHGVISSEITDIHFAQSSSSIAAQMKSDKIMLLEQLYMTAYVIDNQGLILWANNFGMSQLGYLVDDFVGHRFSEVWMWHLLYSTA